MRPYSFLRILLERQQRATGQTAVALRLLEQILGAGDTGQRDGPVRMRNHALQLLRLEQQLNGTRCAWCTDCLDAKLVRA